MVGGTYFGQAYPAGTGQSILTSAVGRSTSFPYDVLVRVGKSAALPYSITINVGRNVAFSYSIIGLAGRSFVAPYSIREHVGNSLEMPFSIGGTGVILFHKHTTSDVYSDGASASYGPATPSPGEISIFATYIIPWLPEGVPDLYIGALGIDTGQRALADAGVSPARQRLRIGWHGTRLDPERGSFAIVRTNSDAAHLLGERVKLSVREHNKVRSVLAYVHNEADLYDAIDMSIPKNLFVLVGLLSEEAIDATVQVLD